MTIPPKLIIAYPLVICDIAIENGPFLVDLPNLKLVIFHSYVSLPEATIFWCLNHHHESTTSFPYSSYVSLPEGNLIQLLTMAEMMGQLLPIPFWTSSDGDQSM